MINFMKLGSASTVALEFLCLITSCHCCFALTPVTTLKEAYKSNFAIGTAVPGADLSPGEQKLLCENFSNITPENCFKPMALEATEGNLTFDRADSLVEFATVHGLKINGHTLVWGESAPSWFFLDGNHPSSPETVRQRLGNYIHTVTTHFRGKVASWDVVNEAISDGPEFLKKTPWLDALGEDYIAEAFKAAHEGDPEAKLYYNDYGIESPGKREKTLRLIRGLKARGVRIDGVGIQGHWRLDHVPMREIEEAVTAFHAEGLDVMITELDLDVVPRNSTGADVTAREQRTRDPYARGCPEEILRRQAGQYASLFTLFRRHAGKIIRVTFWGLHDGRSWLNYWPSKRTNYPLLFDRNLQPKPALTSVIQPSDSSARSSATP